MAHPIRTAVFVALPAAGLLAACAPPGPDRDSFAARVAAEGGDYTAIAERWQEGQTSIRRGEDLVEDGEDAIDEGEELVEDGERMVRRGETLIREGRREKAAAEEAYRTRTGRPSSSVN